MRAKQYVSYDFGVTQMLTVKHNEASSSGVPVATHKLYLYLQRSHVLFRILG